MSLIKSIEDFVQKNEKNSVIEIVEFKTGDPCSLELLKDIEQSANIHLTKDVRNFFLTCNGLHFRWRLRGELEDSIADRFSQGKISNAQYPEDSENPLASINILSIESCFINNEWMRQSSFDVTETYEFACESLLYNDFVKRVIPFDIYSGFSCMAFVLNEKREIGHVLQATKYYDDWHSSQIGDFKDYLDVLQSCMGLCDARQQVYGANDGDKLPHITKKEVQEKINKNWLSGIK